MAISALKTSIENNRHGIRENKKDIHQNKEAINELKTKAVPMEVFEGTVERLEQMNYRLIMVLILALAFLFISNAVWIYAWNTWDNDATTVINKDGVSNFIGGDGEVNNGGN